MSTQKTLCGYRILANLIRATGRDEWAHVVHAPTDGPFLAGRRVVFSSGDAAMEFLTQTREMFGLARLDPCYDRNPTIADVFAHNDMKKRGK